MRDDPILGGTAQKLAALDHFLGGWKNLADRGVDGRTKKAHGNFDLANDDPVDLDPQERNQLEIDETKRFAGALQISCMFSSLTESELDYLREAAEEFISPGAINSIGTLGTSNRTFPTDYADPALRGKPIPANFEKGQKRERGLQLLLQGMQNIDVDTGVGIYGIERDALHREAAANNPALLTALGNIRMGGAPLNRGVQDYTGEQLDSVLLNRLLRLNDEQFMLENGVRAAPADKGSVTKKEDLAFTKLSNAIQKELDSIDTEEAANFMSNQRMAGDRLQEIVGGDSSRGTGERDLVINSGGGDVSIGDNALRKNGKNGNH